MSGERNPVNGQGQTGGSGRTRAEIIERRMRVWDLQLKGKSFRAIAEEEGISVGQAYKDFQNHAKAIQTPLAEEVRTQEMHRLDMLLDKLSERVDAGDVQAVTAFLKVMERRAKMLGLDAPTKMDATVRPPDGSDTTLVQLILAKAEQNDTLAEQIKGEG